MWRQGRGGVVGLLAAAPQSRSSGFVDDPFDTVACVAQQLRGIACDVELPLDGCRNRISLRGSGGQYDDGGGVEQRRRRERDAPLIELPDPDARGQFLLPRLGAITRAWHRITSQQWTAGEHRRDMRVGSDAEQHHVEQRAWTPVPPRAQQRIVLTSRVDSRQLSTHPMDVRRAKRHVLNERAIRQAEIAVGMIRGNGAFVAPEKMKLVPGRLSPQRFVIRQQ